MSIQKQYAERDILKLDKIGNCRHMLALTAEDLRSKSDIAAELAWRDAEIDRLRTELSELRTKAEEQAVPYGCVVKAPGTGPAFVKWFDKSQEQIDYFESLGWSVTKVYTAPPAQAASLTTPTLNASCVPDFVKTPLFMYSEYAAEHLHLELVGVIWDVEHGRGFDSLCLQTIKRVSDKLALLAAAPSPTGLDNPESPRP